MAKHYGPTALQRGGLRAIDCHACGYAHLQPLPTEEQLRKLYRGEYYQSHHPHYFHKERREQWYWRKVYGARLDFFEWLVSHRLKPRQKRLVLDCGAGCGWFVKVAQGRDRYEVHGVEPSSKAVFWASKNLDITLNTHPTDLPDLWHFIHCSLVLEHVLDPLALLQDFYRWLKPGGVACIVVPNEFNPYQHKLTRWGYSPLAPHHINYFTQATLRALAGKAGFYTARVTSTVPLEWFALHGLNYVKVPKLGTVAHWMRMGLEAAALSFAPDTWDNWRDSWAARGVGREVELWVIK